MMRSALQKSGALASKAMAKPSCSIGSVRFMAKQIKFGVEGRAAMLRGVDTLADAVQVRYCRYVIVCCSAPLFSVCNGIMVLAVVVLIPLKVPCTFESL